MNVTHGHRHSLTIGIKLRIIAAYSVPRLRTKHRSAVRLFFLTAAGVPDCGQLPGTCNAPTSWNTRHVSLCTNRENALLLSSFNTFCIQPEKIDAHFAPCWRTISWSQDSLNHSQSFFWPGDKPACNRARRSSTSKRRFLDAAPPALLLPSPKAARVKVLIACLHARRPSMS